MQNNIERINNLYFSFWKLLEEVNYTTDIAGPASEILIARLLLLETNNNKKEAVNLLKDKLIERIENLILSAKSSNG